MKQKPKRRWIGPVEQAIRAERLKNEQSWPAHQEAIKLLNKYLWDYDRAIAEARRRNI
jgi:hypothetical protein